MNITLNNRMIGVACPAYIVAEMSANHNQDFDTAVRIIKAAKDAGADAIKLQTYTPDTLTLDCDTNHFYVGGGTIWEGRKLYDLYAEAHMPWDWQVELKAVADELEIDLFSTPFDRSSIEFLEELDLPAYKIASFEIVDLSLIRSIATTGKPIIMSTGMSTLAEIDEAVRTIREAGCNDLALLKCTSAYPASPSEMNLRTIPHLSETFNVPVGLSDHTLGTTVPIVAATLGACIIEKHFTLSRETPGPDSAFSMEPNEFRLMVEAIRITEASLGQVEYGVSKLESPSRVFRRSLFVVQEMKAGEIFTEENVRSIRPGYGLHPRYLDEIIGQRARCDIKRGTPLSWSIISGS